MGMTRPIVRRRPLVTVIVTGDELRPPEEEQLAPGQIRNSNGPMLAALLTELGANVVETPTVGDHEKAFLQTLHRATQDSDAVITSGGVSMGDYDVVKAVLSRFDEVDVWQVAMKPAKPSAFGLVHDVPVFALPGNPVSVTVGFEQFARPALLHMMGASRLFRPRVLGVLGEPVRSDPHKIEFKRAVIAREGDNLVVRLAGGQGSHQLAALALADAFAVVPVGVPRLQKGDPVEVELFRAAESRAAAEALG